MRYGWRWIVMGTLALAGCRRDMYDQPHLAPYEASTFYEDGTSARVPVEGTVARGEWSEHERYAVRFVEKSAAEKAAPPAATNPDEVRLATDEFPFPVDAAVMRRGQDRYKIYCTPCHGQLGDGRGMIVLRGLSQPPSYHSQTIREQPVGHYVDVIENGHGAMYPYGARVAPRDRWAIAAYIRALQYSQGRPVDELPEDDRARVLASGGQ